MSDSNFKKVRLSPEGEMRRREMLQQLQGEMELARQKRTKFRAGSVIVGCLALLLFSVRFFDGTPKAPSDTIVDKVPEISAGGSAETIALKFIDLEQNRENVTGKYVVARTEPIQPSRVVLQLIDDFQLSQHLAEVGRPSVVGRINGEFRIVSLD